MNPNHAIRKSRVTPGVAALLGALAVSAAAQEVRPPEPAVPVSDVKITVRQAHAQAQLISVPVNQGALVDFSVPVREVRVANPDIADVTAVTPKQILINGRSCGTTQLVALVDGGQQQTFTVAVDIDLERLQATLRAMFPRARVQVAALQDSIVLSGTVPDAESAERIVQVANIYSKDKVINHLRVAGVFQVLLRCTVAEVNRTATRRLGFNGWLAGDDFQDVFAVSNIAGINPVNIGAAEGINATATIPFATGEMGLTATPQLSIGFPRVQMQVFIQALRDNGLLHVLAEPNLLTVSGQEATFLAGGEFPIPVPQSGSTNAITVEFKEFGVRLKFTPTVLGDDLLRIHIAPEVSEPDYASAIMIGGYAVPGLIQRKVDTFVELGPGQTFAIGGLLSEKTRANASRVPALGDIPVLGALFSSVNYQKSESELVVLVTPELVAPLNPDQVLHVPGADVIAPNDWELFGLGKLEGEGRPAGRPPNEAPAAEPAAVQPGGRPTALRLRGPVGPAGGHEGT